MVIHFATFDYFTHQMIYFIDRISNVSVEHSLHGWITEYFSDNRETDK